MPRLHHFSILSFALCTAAASAQADVIKLVKGSSLAAKVWEEGPDEVSFNTFFTGIRQVTFGTEHLPAKAVKQIVPDPDPHRTFWRQAATLADGNAEQWFQLGADADKNKLRGLARQAWTEALVRDRNHAGALRALDTKAKEILAADPRLNAALQAKLTAYLALPDFAAREQALREIQALGSPWPFHYLERAWRSAREKKGRTEQRLLTLRSKDHKGTYCLYVPPSYDPLRPTPLVVALHGGGRGGKDGKAVVGSGESAMNFYESGAATLGWIVVCPTAIAAPWSEKVNDGFLLSVVDEMCALFNVDRNRIYLTGHSMGGFGTWHYGPAYAHRWAAIAPMSGGGKPDLKRLQETLTGVYLYHGANDPVVGVGNDHELALAMKRGEQDFVYAEIPDSGHGFPTAVATEMWDFFRVRRLAVTPDRSPKGKFTVTQEAESSFLAKPTADEIAYFGPLGKPAAVESETQEVTAMLKDLRAGGGRGKQAAEKLATMKDPALADRVAKILADPLAPADTRRFCADTLGGMAQPSTGKALAKALADESLDVVGSAALALARVGGPEAPKALVRSLEDVRARFDKKLNGSRADFSDFEAHLTVAAQIVDALAITKDPGAVPALLAAEGALLSERITVDASDRAGQNPAKPRRLLALRLAEAAAAIGAKPARPLLDWLISRPDLGAVDRAQEILGGAK